MTENYPFWKFRNDWFGIHLQISWHQSLMLLNMHDMISDFFQGSTLVPVLQIILFCFGRFEISIPHLYKWEYTITPKLGNQYAHKINWLCYINSHLITLYALESLSR